MPSSSDTPVRKHFDYNCLDVSDAVFIQQQTDEIRLRKRRAAEDMLEIGRRLVKVKARLRHGQFLTWLEAEAHMSQDTAERVMNIAEFCEENPQFAEFADRFAQAAFYVVSAPSTSKPAREEALARAKAGEFITHKVAKQTKHKHAAPAPTQEPVLTSQPAVGAQWQLAAQQGQPTPSPTTAPEQVSTGPVMVSELASPSVSRQRASEALSHRQQAIMAIRPQPSLSPPTETETVARSTAPAAEPRAKFVQAGTWWQLGENHLLYCGEPASVRFRERLPEQIALSLAFPPAWDEWPQAPASRAGAALSWLTRYEQDQDLLTLWKMIECSLLLSTNGGDTVVVSFLPYADLLLLVHELACHIFCAEPDPGRCEAAIRTWRAKGLRAEKITGLRF